MADPELSILIAARNEEVLLPGCLASIAAQDAGAGRVEAVVIANGCTDRTAALAREWAAAHPEIPCTVLELPEGNISGALNAGAAAARGGTAGSCFCGPPPVGRVVSAPRWAPTGRFCSARLPWALRAWSGRNEATDS